MTDAPRPRLASDLDRTPVERLVADFEAGFNDRDADRFDALLADDVLWGSPFGAVVDGWAPLHDIHARQMPALPSHARSRYELEHVRFPAENVAVAFVRRHNTEPADAAEAQAPEAFDELALLVLVERDGDWWLAAGQHVPDRREEVYG